MWSVVLDYGMVEDVGRAPKDTGTRCFKVLLSCPLNAYILNKLEENSIITGFKLVINFQ